MCWIKSLELASFLDSISAGLSRGSELIAPCRVGLELNEAYPYSPQRSADFSTAAFIYFPKHIPSQGLLRKRLFGVTLTRGPSRHNPSSLFPVKGSYRIIDASSQLEKYKAYAMVLPKHCCSCFGNWLGTSESLAASLRDLPISSHKDRERESCSRFF